MRSSFQRLAGFFRELDLGLAKMRGEVGSGAYRVVEGSMNGSSSSGGAEDSGERDTAVGPVPSLVVRIQIREGHRR